MKNQENIYNCMSQEILKSFVFVYNSMFLFELFICIFVND